jgi:hypothetical protein
MENEMSAVMTQQQLPAMPEPANILDVIARAANDPNTDVAKMEKLLEMFERISSRRAESDFNDAMAMAQSEMGRIAADAVNPQTRSKYVSYTKLDKVLRPIYTRHGFAISFDTADSTKPDHVRVVAYVARGGYSRTYQVDMPADGKGAKGGDVMTKTHASGAAISYGTRYLLKAIFNVAVGDEDVDGNAPKEQISEAQIKRLEALIAETGSDRAKFLKYLKVDRLDQILTDAYPSVVKLLEAKKVRS